MVVWIVIGGIGGSTLNAVLSDNLLLWPQVTASAGRRIIPGLVANVAIAACAAVGSLPSIWRHSGPIGNASVTDLFLGFLGHCHLRRAG